MLHTEQLEQALLASVRMVPPQMQIQKSRAHTLKLSDQETWDSLRGLPRRVAGLENSSTLFRSTVAIPMVFDLIRAPEGYALKPGTRLQLVDGAADLPGGPRGLYVVMSSLGPWSRVIEIAVVGVKEYEKVAPWDAVGVNHAAVMKSILNDPRCTRETIIAALEQTEPGLGFPALHGDEGIDFAKFGGV
jgi:hypothetical protein